MAARRQDDTHYAHDGDDRRWPEVAEFRRDACLHELVQERARRSPGAVAALQGDRSLTYEELNGRANRLAFVLAEREVAPEELVGVCAERSLENLVAILAVLKAGAAYVPIDPTYPQNRIDHIVQNASMRVILAQRRFAGILPRNDYELVALDDDDASLVLEQDPPTRIGSDALAYVIHTSGSTGRPKGVMVEHRGVVNLVEFYLDFHGLGEGDRATQLMRPGFDASVVEIWPMLAAGATVCIPDERIYMDPSRLVDWMTEVGITFSDVPTALAEALFAEALPEGLRLRALITGGDKLRARPPESFPVPVYDQYGPTENTVITTQGVVLPEAQAGEALDIGRPIPNHRVDLVNERLEPVPDGEPGEMLLAGVGVARGYLNLPEQTAAKFLADPIGPPGSKRYRTGDRAVRLEDGRLQFLGRVDDQVQIRGFRIEPAEVQEQLGAHPAVREALVVPWADRAGTALAAYWIPTDGENVGAAMLREFLSERLPHYMVPTRFVALKSWPLTPNGKVDRNALPVPTEEARSTVPARNDLDRRMLDIWQEVLDVSPIGIEDDFFDIGGQSLLAARIFSRFERELSIELPLALLFDAPTVAKLSDHVSGAAPIDRSSGLVRLQTRGEKPPLFFLPGVGGHVLSFRELARELGDDQPCYGLQDPAFDGESEPFASIEEMAVRFVQWVREIVPEPPYYLCGYSFGGTVALEMARQLRAAGETEIFLGLLDTPAPGYPPVLPLSRRIAVHLDNVSQGALSERTAYVSQRLSNLRARVQSRQALYEHAVEDAMTPRMREVISAHYACAERYQLLPYSGDVTLFRALEHPDWPATSFDDPQMGWGPLIRGAIDVREVPGGHLDIFKGENLHGTASQLRSALDHFQSDERIESSRAAPVRSAVSVRGLRVGFLSTVNPNDPDQLSGMPMSMKQQLLRLGADVVDLVPSTALRQPLVDRVGRKVRNSARRVLGERWVPADSMTSRVYDDPDNALSAFVADAERGSREIAEQLTGRDFDMLFGCCVSTILCDLEPVAPVVYYSDTTARLINSTYPEYVSKPAQYHQACDLIEGRGLARASEAVFATQLARDSAVADYGIDAGHAHVVPMGANVTPSEARAEAKSTPTRAELHLVMTAIDPVRKRTDLAVDVVEKLVDAGWNASLTLIGMTTPRATASPHVLHAGFLRMSRAQDVALHRELLQRAHLMLLPSAGEAFGIAPCEAALEGVPSVVSGVGGLPEVVQHGRTGLVLPSDAAAGAYVDAILSLLDDPVRYQEMSRAAGSRARGEYTWDRWGDRIAEILERVLTQARSC